MATVRVKLSGTPDFRFRALADNGAVCELGASKSIGGDETGFRPMQLLLASLGSCSGIDVVNILKKSRVDFSAVDVDMEGERKDGTPSPFSAVRLRFTVRGRAVENAETRAKAEKAVALAVGKYCSAIASLDPTIKIETVTEVTEAN